MTNSKLSIIIPVFNGWDQTERCLRALEASTSDIPVIVVDHGSTDATKHELTKRFPEITHLLESDELWWSGATNAGIRHVLGKPTTHVVLLNNDCVVEPEALARLAEHAQAAPDAVIAPVQRSLETGHILSAGAVPFVALGFPTLIEHTTVRDSTKSIIEVSLITGGRGVLIPRSVFERVGLFDEVSLPHYLADHDFYLRCRRSGIKLLSAIDATVLVDEKRTSVAADLAAMTWTDFRDSLRNPRSHRNLPALRAFFRKHYPVRSLWWIGLGLNLARYTVRWGLVRAFAKLGVETSRFGRKR